MTCNSLFKFHYFKKERKSTIPYEPYLEPYRWNVVLWYFSHKYILETTLHAPPLINCNCFILIWLVLKNIVISIQSSSFFKYLPKGRPMAPTLSVFLHSWNTGWHPYFLYNKILPKPSHEASVSFQPASAEMCAFLPLEFQMKVDLEMSRQHFGNFLFVGHYFEANQQLFENLFVWLATIDLLIHHLYQLMMQNILWLFRMVPNDSKIIEW